MKGQIDWEQIMKTTQQNASAASRNSENAVGGMVKLIEKIDRHSARLEILQKDILALQKLHGELSQAVVAALNGQLIKSHPSPGLERVAYFAGFLMAAAFVGFIVIW